MSVSEIPIPEAGVPGSGWLCDLYSNFDDAFEPAARERLLANPGSFGSHGALNYHGYVGVDRDGAWIEVVWRHNVPVAAYKSSDLEELILHVIEQHGGD